MKKNVSPKAFKKNNLHLRLKQTKILYVTLYLLVFILWFERVSFFCENSLLYADAFLCKIIPRYQLPKEIVTSGVQLLKSEPTSHRR